MTAGCLCEWTALETGDGSWGRVVRCAAGRVNTVAQTSVRRQGRADEIYRGLWQLCWLLISSVAKTAAVVYRACYWEHSCSCCVAGIGSFFFSFLLLAISMNLSFADLLVGGETEADLQEVSKKAGATPCSLSS